VDLDRDTNVVPEPPSVTTTYDVEQPPVLKQTAEKTYDPTAGYYYDPLISTTGFSIYR